MKSNRLSIILCHDKRQKTEAGVWENDLVETKVKAEKIQVFQKRLTQAMLDGIKVTGRYKVRSELVGDNLRYIIVNGNKYKVNTIYSNIDSHYKEIEAGEQI